MKDKPASTGCGKGDWPRKRQVSKAEFDLRWDYMIGDINKKDFDKKLKEIRNESG